jgi:hypothetical protein
MMSILRDFMDKTIKPLQHINNVTTTFWEN